MADEKTDPTPKAGRTDTMHSTPGMPDRSKGEAATAEDRKATAPATNAGSVGSEKPRQRTIKTENSGTLVEDIPSLDEPTPEEEQDPFLTNKPISAPDGPLALQPNEPLDTDTRKEGPDRGAAKTTRSRSKASDSKKADEKKG